MTRTEYLDALKQKLESFNMELQKDIMEDYEQHFVEGLAAGKTEDEIIEELGSIEDMIQELPEEDLKQEIQITENADEKNGTYEGNFRGIVIEGLVADVIIGKSDDGCIHVDYHNDGDTQLQQRYQFYQYDENNVFHAGIKDVGRREGAKKIILFGKTILSYDTVNQYSGDIQLSVRIPDGISVLEAGTMSGDLKLYNLESGKASLHTASGDIDLTGFRAEAMRLQTGSGDVEAVNFAVGSLTVGTGSGDMELRGSMEECVIKTGSGDVEMKAENGVRRISVTTGSGYAELDLTGIGGAEVHATVGSGECTVYGAGGEFYQVTCGSITVGSGECKVNVQTGSGDVEVRCR